jgi:hypothetical protein
MIEKIKSKRERDRVYVPGDDVRFVRSAGVINEIYDTWC